MDNFISESKIKELNNEYEILHLVYHRNKNQHRQSTWWKYLNILHRYIRKILKLTIDIQRIKSKSAIKYKKEQIIDIIKYLDSKKIFRKSYYEFNGIIALGQFIGLGLTLVGLLSKIYDILISVEGVNVKPIDLISTKEINNELTVGLDDLGEVVDDLKKEPKIEQGQKKMIESVATKDKRKAENIDDIFDMLPSKKTKKLKKKKKKKSDIDDIFG